MQNTFDPERLQIHSSHAVGPCTIAAIAVAMQQHINFQGCSWMLVT